MTDLELADLLERAAERIPVGPPPLHDLQVGAPRRRRRSAAAVVISSAAAVVLAMVGTALLLPPDGTPTSPAATPGVSADPSLTRLVGIGHAAIAVPLSWGTNHMECGTPKEDTVVIGIEVTPACYSPRPAGVDSVELTFGPPRFDFTATDRLVIDGTAAERQATTCAAGSVLPDVKTCAGSVFVPSLGVSFHAESSTDAATVDEILSWIRIVPGAVGVPGFERANMEMPQSGARDRYVAAAHAEGLEVRVVSGTWQGLSPGWVLAVSPAPGTMVPPGTELTVTVVAKPNAPG